MYSKIPIFFFIFFVIVNADDGDDCVENCHKSIFPITFLEIIGYIAHFVLTIITTVGGIGGGAFYLPLFMVFFGFTLKEAIPLSITCVMGILFVRYLLTIKEKHPRRDKPLINYEVCLIFSPSITVGTVFGVLVNKIAPSWVILLLVLVVLGSLGYKTFKKAKALKEAERIMKGKGGMFNLTEHEKTYLMELHGKIRDLNEDILEDDEEDGELKKPRVAHSHYVKQMSINYIERRNEKRKQSAIPYNELKSQDIEMKLLSSKEQQEEDFLHEIQEKIKHMERFENIYRPKAATEDDATNKKDQILDDDVIPPQRVDTDRRSVLKQIASRLTRIIEYESKLVPMDKLGLMILMLVILVIISLIQGSRHFPSIIGIPYCSVPYWIIRLSFLPIGALLLWYAIRYLAREHQEKKESGYIFLKSDITYDFETSMKITRNGVFTGFASAVLGIGGAIFIGPLLLQLGLPPHESTFTASFSALFTAFSSFIQYLLTGLIKWDFAFVLTIIGVLAMYVGIEVVLKWVKRMGSSSIIVEVLAFVIILSTVLIIVSGISFMYMDYNAGIDIWSFRPICTPA